MTRDGQSALRLERFVREALGCTCPPEVFERVEDLPQTNLTDAGLLRRIAIGGRLLIYIAEVDDLVGAVPRVVDWIAEGRTERDSSGMNRLRLVIASDAHDPRDLQLIREAFAAAPGIDDRVHLHFVDRRTVAAI